MIAVQPKQMVAVTEALRAMPELRLLHSVSGSYDLIALGVVPTMDEMDVLTDRIGEIDGVERTTSAFDPFHQVRALGIDVQCAAFQGPLTLKKSDFHYELPPELIAQEPLAERSASRLLVVPPRRRAVCGSASTRSSGFAARGRSAGVQRHPRDSGAAVRAEGQAADGSKS